MTERSWFDYEWQRYDDPDGPWKRASFAKRPDLGYPEPPTDQSMAREMLEVIALRWKNGTKFRLVRMTEEVLDRPEDLVVARGYD